MRHDLFEGSGILLDFPLSMTILSKGDESHTRRQGCRHPEFRVQRLRKDHPSHLWGDALSQKVVVPVTAVPVVGFVVPLWVTIKLGIKIKPLTRPLLKGTLGSFTELLGFVKLWWSIDIPTADLIVYDTYVGSHPLAGHEDRHLHMYCQETMTEGGPVVVPLQIRDKLGILICELLGLLGKGHTGCVDHGKVTTHMLDVLYKPLV